MESHIPAPQPLDFTRPELWKPWIRRFQRYRLGTGLHEKSEESQVAVLIYCLGPNADDAFEAFGLPVEDQTKYDTVVQRLEEHFIPKRNVTFECARFHQRKQQPGEIFDIFSTDLHRLAKFCEFGELRERMIMHQILAGMRDRHLSEKLQMEAKLDLKMCIDRCRQKEFISRQQGLFHAQAEAAAAEPTAVGAVQKSSDKKMKRVRRQKAPPPLKPHDSVGAEKSSAGAESHSMKCGRCGYSPSHPRSKCPARAAKCNSCGKTGHFGSVCRSKRINEIDQSQSEELFFGAHSSEKGRSWKITVTLDENPIEFKIDSGADATVIPESIYRRHWKNPLNPTSQSLKTASGSGFYVLGTFEAKFAVGGKTSTQTVYVIRNLRQALLGLPAIEDLQILSRVNAVTADDDIVSEYPSVFSGLGQFETEYRIELKENAKPWALPAPRRIAIPLRSKVKDELDRMQSLGVISKVERPTDWCAGMVVVVKPNKVRICVDLTKLNLSVKRERHILLDLCVLRLY